MYLFVLKTLYLTIKLKKGHFSPRLVGDVLGGEGIPAIP